MKKIFSIFLFLFISTLVFAKTEPTDTTTFSAEDMNKLNDILKHEQQIKYQTGSIDVNNEINLNVPKGYKFMNKADAEYVVFDLWQNPKQDGILGMLVKEDYSLIDGDSWAFVVTYENSGYVKDEDADKIDYDDLMKDIHESEAEENKQRTKEGFPTIHIIGWATKPFYDKENNILHWAKSIAFGGGTDTTLNYDVRILGRKGILSLNAVGTVSQLKDIQSHVPQIIHIAKFKKGSSYIDFDPSVDKVAAYTIGGLVAGKLLAKAGLIALLLKNIKLVFIAIAAFFGGFGKKIKGFFSRKKEEEPTTYYNNNQIDETPQE